MTIQILQDKVQPSISVSKEELKLESADTNEVTIVKAIYAGLGIAVLLLLVMRSLLVLCSAFTSK